MSQARSRVGRYLRQHHLALLALFIALGGTSYAAASVQKNSVGTKQLKNGAVTTKKIANGAVNASKINVAGLTVPNALHASSADNAMNAMNATNATQATNATNATDATHAADAANADQLGGFPPSAFHDSCPSGTTLAAADLCVTTTNVGTAGSGENTWTGALTDCAALGLRLPSPAEAFLLVSTTPVNLGYWTDDFFQDSGTALALVFTHDSNTPAGRLNNQAATADQPVRCVTTPVNS
jgi:hypothetical protein